MKTSVIREHYAYSHKRFVDQCPFCEKLFLILGDFKQHIIDQHQTPIAQPFGKQQVVSKSSFMLNAEFHLGKQS